MTKDDEDEWRECECLVASGDENKDEYVDDTTGSWCHPSTKTGTGGRRLV